jgi:hypothetical protein
MNYITRSLYSLGLILTCGAAFAQANNGATTNVLSNTTFETGATVPWSYGYFYPGDAAAVGTYKVEQAYHFPEDTDMTNAVYRYTFDLTGLAGRTTSFGTGTGAPLFLASSDPTAFVSGDRADYTFTFQARAEGLAEGQTSANAQAQVMFYSGGTKTLQVNYDFKVTADWQTYSFNLNDGSLGDNTADADFLAHHAETTEVRLGLNLDQPAGAFGYDADNAVDLNDAKLEVVSRPTSTTPTPTFTVPIVDWNFDDKPAWYSYPYQYSQNENVPVATADNNANNSKPNALGNNGTSGWFLQMDNTALVNGIPQWAGAGTGGGGPVTVTNFNSGALSDYRITLDARVDGLVGAQATAALQLFIDQADGPDADTKADLLGQFNFSLTHLTGDWQTFTFDLSKASVDSAVRTLFSTAYTNIVDVRPQFQIESAADENTWGFDADNALYIDNFKVERIFQGLAPLSISQSGDQITVNWTAAATGTTKLQAADSVEGPYNDVDVTGTTYSTSTSGMQKYFRLSWTAPENP